MRTIRNSVGMTRSTDCNTLRGASVNVVSVTTMQETTVANNLVDVREKSRLFVHTPSLRIHVYYDTYKAKYSPKCSFL